MKNLRVGAGNALALPSLSVACSHYNGSIAMADDIFSDTERRMQKAIEALRHDLAVVRTGRASAALLERIQIDYYGVPTPINQVATITVPDARMLMIQPWDRKLLTDIEKAIQRSDLGINPNNDGQVIRLNIPPLNEERRREMVKTVHKKLDEHKVAIRNVRRDCQEKLRDREKKKEISEDELKRSTERLQKLTDRFIDEMDKVGKTKELEILEV
jgi:ribosome recycling factor